MGHLSLNAVAQKATDHKYSEVLGISIEIACTGFALIQ